MMIISALLTGFMRHESAFYVFRAVTGLGGALVTASNFGMLQNSQASTRKGLPGERSAAVIRR